MTSTRYAPISAATAIAVVLAFSSTASLAQEAQPTTTDPASPVSATPSPAPDTAPADTAAPAATDTSASVTTRTVKHTTRVAAAKPAPGVTHKTTRTVTTHATVPAAAAPTLAAAASTPAANTPTKLNPIVDMKKAKPANAQAQAVKPAHNVDETAMIAGGGAFALLALGGGAYALARRRRRWDEEAMLANEADTVDEPGTMGRQDPIFEHEPPVIAPSAFAWGNAQPVEQQAATQADDRKPGETWVEHAYRGPSADNPSLSLRKRLKRAAFFDKRDREVAAGMAKPVEADAGLPESVDEPADSSAPSTYERELEAA